jgi:hypothetical protein
MKDPALEVRYKAGSDEDNDEDEDEDGNGEDEPRVARRAVVSDRRPRARNSRFSAADMGLQ